MTTRQVPRLNDRDLIRVFEKVSTEFEEESCSVTYRDQFGDAIEESTLDLLKDLAGYKINSATLSVGNTAFRVARQPVTSPPYFDSIEYYFNKKTQEQGGRPANKDAFFEIDVKLHQALADPLISPKSSEEYSAILSHGTILEKMESVTALLIEKNDEFRRQLQVEHSENESRRQKELDALISLEREKSEAYRTRLAEEFAKRHSTLDETQKELDTLKKSLDDRNNTHVRREIRTTISGIISDRLQNFTVSKATKTQYLTVNAASIAGFVILAGASFYFGSQIQVDPQTKKYGPEAIALIIKSASFGAATIALGSWYLGWLNRWFQRIADSEFKLQQFRLDIERASWLAETVLEWKSSSQEPFPELLATRLSDGLFQSTGSSADGPRTPASHLAEALFGSASSAKIRVGENELNFDRSGIKRLDE